MKKVSILFCLNVFAFATTTFAQLPPVAQALYTECYNADVLRGQYSVTNGVLVKATPDSNSFYLQWFPLNATPASSPLLVTLHGTAGTAFDEFYLWHQYAAAHGVGIIAIQWYRGAAASPPNDYFDDVMLYRDIDTALTRIQYPSNNAFFHGFSRGSAMSYAIAFRDQEIPLGKNYFCTVMSNSGKADSTYYLYNQINAGTYGHSLFNGLQWAMYCGGLDPGPLTCCNAMNNSRNWVQANGGTVGLYISDPNLGHGGFHQTPAYIDSALNFYLQCYTPTSVHPENLNKTNFQLFPNPVENKVTLTCQNGAGGYLAIYDAWGILRKELILESDLTQIDLSDFTAGIYFVQFAQGNQRIGSQKLVIIK